MAYQQEIKFFYPLTEQIPLDLEYSVCAKSNKQVFEKVNTFTFSAVDCNTMISVSSHPSDLIVDVDKVTFKLKKKPSVMRQWLYKLIGLNWEIKGK